MYNVCIFVILKEEIKKINIMVRTKSLKRYRELIAKRITAELITKNYFHKLKQ